MDKPTVITFPALPDGADHWRIHGTDIVSPPVGEVGPYYEGTESTGLRISITREGDKIIVDRSECPSRVYPALSNAQVLRNAADQLERIASGRMGTRYCERGDHDGCLCKECPCACHVRNPIKNPRCCSHCGERPLEGWLDINDGYCADCREQLNAESFER